MFRKSFFVVGFSLFLFLFFGNNLVKAQTSCTTPVSLTNKNLEVYESTAGNYAVRYNFDLASIVYGDIDIQTGAQEKYDIYRSDANGNPLADGTYITVYQVRNYISDEDTGNNIDSVVLIDKTTGVRNPATTVASYAIGTSGSGDGLVSNILGEPDNKVTYMGDLQSRITVGFYDNCQSTPTALPTETPVTTIQPSCLASTSFSNKNLEVYESTAGNYAVRYNFDLASIVYGDIDIQTGAQEKYDIYRSDANGNPLANGTYISIYQVRNYIGDDQGNNIDSVVLIDKTTGVRNPATFVASKLNGTSLGLGDDKVNDVLGEPDNKVTYMGDLQSRITVGFYDNCQSPTPAPSGQCSMTKVYTNNWTELTPEAFKKLASGIQVYFCVNGVTNVDTFDAGRFTINGVTRPETTIKRPATNDFCDAYTIPANTYLFKVQGEIHHAQLGWL